MRDATYLQNSAVNQTIASRKLYPIENSFSEVIQENKNSTARGVTTGRELFTQASAQGEDPETYSFVEKNLKLPNVQIQLGKEKSYPGKSGISKRAFQELATTREHTKMSREIAPEKINSARWPAKDGSKHPFIDESVFKISQSSFQPPKLSKKCSRLNSVEKSGKAALRTFNKNYKDVKEYLKELKSQIGYNPPEKSQATE